jgi:hypothetical protein
VTWPSSVARHGTIAGTHVRSAATQPRLRRTGANQRAREASSRVGQRAARSGCRTRRRDGVATATWSAYRGAAVDGQAARSVAVVSRDGRRQNEARWLTPKRPRCYVASCARETGPSGTTDGAP